MLTFLALFGAFIAFGGATWIKDAFEAIPLERFAFGPLVPGLSVFAGGVAIVLAVIFNWR